MKSLGIWLAIFGVGSLLLNLMGMEFKILMWIDNWGHGTGMAIRGGLTAAGVVLFVIGWRQESAKPSASTEAGKNA
ncbi:MAG: hypothetical protein A2140_03015 [Candidatus Muproteobacteria bacterium RBG_16_62_13]|uniref:DUF378 domain-containing protein n=1 Tax=Candidatus Muproteobacteria bacterium RBG_16_62_13 TaxID=1817756 RepID=A0A1F6T557_9PROT|nr:MAG: hypothetical protein A2140_03015 [Candidatus Muproteobacteria bacterium RBG_16_62_13]